ncbi:MAG TPA: VOC family protein [Vicinamibacteria bacterium]|nr:VOC family protein [Vicinamibacteria bacterium]
MKPLAAGLLLVALAAPTRGEVPDLYRKVASVHWVVRDLDRVKAGWAKLGFLTLDLGEVTATGSFQGQHGSSRFRLAQARLAGAEVLWIQPLESESAFSDHLARHGEGVFSINYAVPSREALDAEVARLTGLGVGVLQRGEVTTPAGRLTVVHMDTAAEGKYVLGLVHDEAPGPAPEVPPTATPLKLSQYALVVRSLEKVSAYWERLGFPAMEITHGPLSDLVYRGQPGRFDQRLGWHRHGTVTWEWIEPVAGPTVYEDFLKEHGEGFHHFAFDVPDIDAAEAFFESHGAAVVQSGAWGDKGKPGSGRFAYAATDGFGGVTTEFLWNLREGAGKAQP